MICLVYFYSTVLLELDTSHKDIEAKQLHSSYSTYKVYCRQITNTISSSYSMRTSLSTLLGAMPLYLLALALLWLPFLSQDRVVQASPLSLTERSSTSFSELSVPFDTRNLSKRAQVPSTDELVALIDKNPNFVVGSRPSIFWTSLYDPAGGLPYLKVRNWGLHKFGNRCNFYLYTDMLADAD